MTHCSPCSRERASTRGAPPRASTRSSRFTSAERVARSNSFRFEPASEPANQPARRAADQCACVPFPDCSGTDLPDSCAGSGNRNAGAADLGRARANYLLIANKLCIALAMLRLGSEEVIHPHRTPVYSARALADTLNGNGTCRLSRCVFLTRFIALATRRGGLGLSTV